MSGGRDWLAFGVAAYGAVVASCVALYQFRRDRPGVKLVLTAITAVSEKNPEHIELWGIRVVNHRKRPITIQEAGVLRGRLRVAGLAVDFYGVRIPDPFPRTLEDGEAVEVYIHAGRRIWAGDRSLGEGRAEPAVQVPLSKPQSTRAVASVAQ